MSLREQCQNLERVANNGLTNSEVLEAATGDLRFEVLSFREEYTSAVQTTWTLLSAFVAFLILAGLALVQVAVSRSHSDNVLFKHGVGICVSAVFFIFGYVLAYGEGNVFIGGPGFDFTTIEYDYALFRFQFAAIAAAIVGGCLEGRVRDSAYITFAALNALLVHTLPAHWVWTRQGWLAEINAIDLAGAASVHVVGGMAALIGSLLIGPRVGRFRGVLGRRTCVAGTRMPSYAVGTLIIWFGWFGLVAAAPRFVSGITAATAGARAAANIAIAGGVGGLMAATLNRVNRKTRDWDLGATCNGIMAGLVSVSAGGHVFQAWAAALVALIGSGIYFGGAKLMQVAQIDDATEAVPVHLVCGFWALVAVGFFADSDLVATSVSLEGAPLDRLPAGLLTGGDGLLLGIELLVFLCAATWSALLSLLIFGALSMLDRLKLKPGDALATEFVFADTKMRQRRHPADQDDGEYSYSYSDEYQYVEIGEDGTEKVLSRRQASAPPSGTSKKSTSSQNQKGNSGKSSKKSGGAKGEAAADEGDDSEASYVYSYEYEYLSQEAEDAPATAAKEKAAEASETSEYTGSSSASDEETDDDDEDDDDSTEE